MRIDLWTLALQTLNVLVLVWLLARFLFRPVAAVIAARREAADRLLSEAAATRQQATDEAAALAQQRAAIANDAQHMLAEARTAAEAERTVLLQHAADAAAKLQAEAQQATARDRQAMRAALEREATDLALTIARRLLERVPPRALTAAFLATLADTLAADPRRAALAISDLEVRAAIPLDSASQAEARDILARALGGAPHLTFRTDPTLIAGIELAAPDVLIRNSWRTDLERLSQALHEADIHAVTQPVA